MCHRVDVHEELRRLFLDESLERVPHGKLHLGKRVVSCDFEKNTVTFGSGETVGADLIIGSDGIRVRR